MRVANVNGTSDLPCPCGSWLEHWKRFSGRALPPYCPEVNCYEKPVKGVHVMKENPSDSAWYIIPLCEKHSAATGKSLEVSRSIKLALANVGQTCGRKSTW